MASILVPPSIESVEPADRLFTTADLPLFPTNLPSGTVDYELRMGRLVIMVPPGSTHGSLQLRIGSALLNQGEEQGHGKAFAEIGVVLSRKPDTVVGSDLAFIGKSKLPVRQSSEGYLETMPDLVVEVRSKNDSRTEVERKTAEYLSAGVEMVWNVDPDAKTIVVHRPKQPPRTYSESETLALDDPIPGFRLNLMGIFAE